MLLAMAALLVALTAGLAIAQAVIIDCNDDPQQYCAGDLIKPTNEDYIGSDGRDNIAASTGDDTGDGKGGDDFMVSGPGDDGDEGDTGGNDGFDGGEGNDTILGREGNEVELDGDEGDDTILGDVLWAFDNRKDQRPRGNVLALIGDDGDPNNIQDDSLRGEGGKNEVRGGEGDDAIDADTKAEDGGDVEEIFAGKDNDVIVAADGVKDIIDCDEGDDTVFFDEGLDEVSNCENQNPDPEEFWPTIGPDALKRASSDLPADDDEDDED
jgi:Ca2+-binding RTX toxin-like protein